MPAIAVCVGAAALVVGVMTGNLQATELTGQALIDYQRMLDSLPLI